MKARLCVAVARASQRLTMGTSTDPANPSMDRPRYWLVKNAAYWGMETNSDGHVGPISENDLLYIFMERLYNQPKTYEPNTNGIRPEFKRLHFAD